jgi:hypothetical protein
MNPPRYALASLNQYGVTSLHLRNPLIVAWWSAAFPGFGHFLLNQYLRGTFLTLSEVIFNSLSHLNEAMVYSFCGKFAQAKADLEPRWILGYILVFFIAIWDSYRSAIYQNKICYIARLENAPLPVFRLYRSEVQYIQRKNPWVGVGFSFVFPGFGQLYSHRIGLGFYAITWWWIYITLSHLNESIIYLINGRMEESVLILHPHWLLFMPSVIGGSMYHAYVITREHNLLYCLEQRQYLRNRYDTSSVRLFSDQGEAL